MLKVNGKAYDWGDVDFAIPGLTLEVQDISYDDEFEKEHAYGKGNKPRGYGTGNYKPNAKMTVLRDDYDEILDYCKRTGTPLYKLNFPKVSVSYANDGGRTRTDVLNKVSLSKNSHKAAQGDKQLKVDIDLFVAGTIVRDGVQPV